MMVVRHLLIAGNALLAISAQQAQHRQLIKYRFAQKVIIVLKVLQLLQFALSVIIVLKELMSLLLVHPDTMVRLQDYLKVYVLDLAVLDITVHHKGQLQAIHYITHRL